MEITPWSFQILFIVGGLILALVIYLIVRRFFDEKQFEHDMNEKFHQDKRSNADSEL